MRGKLGGSGILNNNNDDKKKSIKKSRYPGNKSGQSGSAGQKIKTRGEFCEPKKTRHERQLDNEAGKKSGKNTKNRRSRRRFVLHGDNCSPEGFPLSSWKTGLPREP